MVNQPFYTYDDQNDEQFYIIDNDSYDQPNSVDTTNNIDSAVEGLQTVEAVKQRLVNDPKYRRELLERVIPQFSKMNEKFTNSFLYQLKYNVQQ